MTHTVNISLRRDALTWLMYITLGTYAYSQSAMGPIVPFLRDEMNLNYTITGFHLSAFAVGMMGAGYTGDHMARRIGRKRLILIGGAGMGLGAVLLLTGWHPILTITGAGLMGLLGTFVLVMVQAILSDHHGENRAIGLTESNIVASLLSIFPAVLIRLGTETPFGWRLALAVAVILWTAILLMTSQINIPAATPHRQRDDGKSEPLSPAFWAFWVVIFLAVGTEWCVVFWGADFLENHHKLPKETAAFLMGLFFAAMLVGRIIGSRLSATLPSRQLLIGALGVLWIGFPIFWLGNHAIWGIIGLFITGVGVANLFPLTLAAAANTAPEQADTASARLILGSGSAIFLMPQIMGNTADRVGIHTAFGLVLVLMGGAFIAALVANHLVAHQNNSR